MGRKLDGQLTVITCVEVKTVLAFLIGLGLGLISAGALLSSNATVPQYDQDEISAPQEYGPEVTAPSLDGNPVRTWQLRNPLLAVQSNINSNVPSSRSVEQGSVGRSERSQYGAAKDRSTISSRQLPRRLPPKISSEVPRERPADSGQVQHKQPQPLPIAGQLRI